MLAELRGAAANIKRRPGAPIVAGLSLALGMALATVVFSMVEALFLHPLPFGQQDRLYRLYTFAPLLQRESGGLFIRQFFAVREASRSFEVIGATRSDYAGVLVGESGDAFRVSSAQMTTNYLEVLDLRPAYGRPFVPEDVGTSRVLISNTLWQSRFAGARDVVGREITLNGRRAEVIGILPSVFKSQTAVWFPLGDDELRAGISRDAVPFLSVTGKALRGVTREAIDAELSVLFRRVDAPVPNAPVMISRAFTMAEEYAGSWRGQLGMWAAVAILITILCAVNFATVSLARGMRRRAEIAIRTALGASVGRIVAMLTYEAALIAAIGGVFAVLLAAWLLGVRSAAFGVSEMIVAPTISWPVVVFGIIATVLVGFFFALAPALQLAHANLRPLLGGGSQTESSRTQVRARRGLVAVQLGLSLAAIAVLVSLVSLERKKLARGPGYEHENFMTADIFLRDSGTTITGDALHAFMQSLPSVRAATVANNPTRRGATPFLVEGRELPAAMGWRDVPADFFSTMGAQLIAGRLPTPAEYATHAPVMVVSAWTERWLFGYQKESSLGRRVSIVSAPRSTPKWFTIIGVVSDIRLDRNFVVFDPANYTFLGLPISQSSAQIVIRTQNDPNLLVRSLRDQLARFDASVIVNDASTVKSQVNAWVARSRGTLWSFTGVALLAFVLATVGIFGLTSYAAEVRSREIGIHVALGASRTRVIVLMLADLTATAIASFVGGMILGLKGVMIVDDMFRDPLLDMPTASFVTTPIVFAAVGLLLIGLVGTFVPIRRLLRQDLARVMQA